MSRSAFALISLALCLQTATSQSRAGGGDIPFEHRIVSQAEGAVAVADLDGDGRNDIVQRGSDGRALVWYRYEDDGSFEKHVVIEGVRFRSDRIVVGDVDLDGDLDIVTGRSVGDTDESGLQMVWIENPLRRAHPAATAEWKVREIGTVADYVKDIGVVDLDRDGRPDVIARMHDETRIFFQQPGLRWWPRPLLHHHPHEGMDVADFDLDGDPDLVLNGFWLETPEDPRTDDFTAHVIDAKWFAPFENSWRDSSAQVVVADVTEDGLPDVLFSNSELPGFPISLYIAASVADIRAGRWTERRVAGEFDYCQTLAVGDVDMDGDLDVLAAKFERDHEDQNWRNQPPFPVIVFRNLTGDGRAWAPQMLSEDGLYAAEFGDVGSDGDLDVVGPRSYWTGPLELWENRSADQPLALDRWHYIRVDDRRTGIAVPGGASWWKAFGLDMGDLNHDGYADIVSGEYFYLNPGGDMSGTWRRGTFPIELDAFLVTDVDGDAFADVIAQMLPDVYWLEATNVEATAWSVLPVSSLAGGGHGNTQLYGAAQLVPGGRPEILLGSEGGRMSYIEIPEDPQRGNWPQTRISTEGGGYAAGDIDGDGYIDVAGSYQVEVEGPVLAGTYDVQQGNSRAAWWKNPGDGSADWQRFTIGTCTQADRFTLADLNGDGRLDLAVSEERYWGLEPNADLQWFEQPSDSSKAWTRHLVVEQFSMNNLDASDVDRDGDIDLITNEHRMPKDDMVLEEIEQTQVWENDGTGRFTEHRLEPGRESHLGAQAVDMDGDGDLDIVSIAWRNFQNLHLWRNDAVRRDERPAKASRWTSLATYGTATPDVAPPYRLPIEVQGAGVERTNGAVQIDLNFTQRLDELGSREPFVAESLRLVEVDAQGHVIDADVPFQFETPEDFNARKWAVGTLVFLLKGTTPATATRYYDLFFGGSDPALRRPVDPPLVTVEDFGPYAGDDTFRIVTPAATYFYHQHGSGFASLVDRDGHDWISYHPGGGPKGEYRGIPNIAPAGFHPGPGESNRTTRILAAGPVRVRLLSETADLQWRVIWDVYPGYAEMTLLRKGEAPFWILYEGTPGGTFNLTDYWVDSQGRRFEMPGRDGPDHAWHGALPAPQWVYFGDANLDRVLYLALHEPDDIIDEFWHFGEEGMTVFGFGRGPRDEGWQRLETVPAHLTIGFVESDDHRNIASTIGSAIRPLRFAVGRAERTGQTEVTPTVR